MSFEIEPGVSGVLPAQWIERAIESGYVRTPKRTPIPPRNVQPASLDLRLGTKAYRIQASFLPDREAVETKLQEAVAQISKLHAENAEAQQEVLSLQAGLDAAAPAGRSSARRATGPTGESPGSAAAARWP